jgi:hypothetical protein
MDLDHIKKLVDACIAEGERTGDTKTTYDALVTYVRSHCNGSCDIALARRQVGPDAVVPGDARECAELWEREAARLAKLDRIGRTAVFTSYSELGALDLRDGDVVDAEDVRLYEAHLAAIRTAVDAYRKESAGG